MKGYQFFAILFLLNLSACSNLPGNKEGNIAIDFNLKDVGGKEYKLANYKGKLVMLHFWTDWCNSCRAEFPRVQDFYSELKNDDFELLAINVGQPRATSQEFQSLFNISFPMLVDDKGYTKDLFDLNAYPTNFFIAPDGKIIRIIKGWVDKKQVEVIINQHKPESGVTAQQL